MALPMMKGMKMKGMKMPKVGATKGIGGPSDLAQALQTARPKGTSRLSTKGMKQKFFGKGGM